jgi:hypothetical protein
MEHCQLPVGPLELDQQEVVNNTNEQWNYSHQAQSLPFSNMFLVGDRGSEEDVVGEGAV